MKWLEKTPQETATSAGAECRKGSEPDEPRAVVEFRDVSLPPLSRRYEAMQHVNLTLREGGCALVVGAPARDHLPLADAALGLIEPAAGEVRFLGDNWTRLAPREQLARRARVGRVFERPGWINNLTALENVLLPRRHHTALADERLLAEALTWAARFGLEAVPDERPSSLAAEPLRLAEWVRAFSIRPALLLLEQPTRGVSREYWPSLLEAVEELRRCRAAVLWITGESEAEIARGCADHALYRVHNGTLVKE